VLALSCVIPAEAGIQGLGYEERRWTPAWPFLETAPVGLVFAGVTEHFLSLGEFIPDSSALSRE